MSKYIDAENILIPEGLSSWEAEIVLAVAAAQPAADVQKVVHGRWIDIGDDDNPMWQCSNCKHPLFIWGERGTHCRFCGAKMDLGVYL